MKELNLLQEEKQAQLRKTANARSAVRTSVFLGVVALGCIASLSVILGLMQRRASSLNEELAQTKLVAPSGKSLPVSETTKKLNRRLNALSPIFTDRDVPVIIANVSNILPSGIKVTDISVSLKNKSLRVKGVAATRNDIPLLQSSVDSLSEISDTRVNSNINDRTNVQFELTATILQQQPV